MNTPSIKTLRAVFLHNAKRAKFILHAGQITLNAAPECQARILECYNRPDAWDLRMHALNTLAKAHGAECLTPATIRCGPSEYPNGYGRAWFLNTGDTYAATLIFWRGRYRVQSIGDFVEVMERRGIRFN